MDAKSVLTPQFFELYKTIENISIVGAYDLSLTREILSTKRQKAYKFACFFVGFWYGALNGYGIYTSRDVPIAMLLEIGAMGAVVTSVSATYDFLMYRDEYKEILFWIASLHVKFRKEFNFLYEKAFFQSKKIIKASILILAGTQIIMLGFGCFIQFFIVPIWDENGKFNINLPYPYHFPWIPNDGWIGFFINFILQHLGQANVFVAYVLFMSINVILLIFVEVHLEILMELLARVSDNIKLDNSDIDKKKNQENLIEIITMHAKITEYMNRLVKLTKRTFFTFKINSFVFAFFIYVALFADKSNQIQALGGFGGLSLSFWIAYSCNIFEKANDRLYDAVNDIPWYEMSPKDRQILIPFIMKLQQPSLLRSSGIGSSEIITFEQFAATIQTVYSWCLVIQKVLVK